MAKLTITRVAELLGDRGRYLVRLDGEPVEEVRYGESVEVDIQPGPREVVVELNRYVTNPISIDVEPEGAYHLQVGSRVSGWIRMFSTVWLGFFPFWSSRIPYDLTLFGTPLVFVFAHEARLGKRLYYLRVMPGTSTSCGTETDPRRRISPAGESDARFSIRWLMIVIAVLAVLLGIDTWLNR